jgi:SAM-dependent methyltransferase
MPWITKKKGLRRVLPLLTIQSRPQIKRTLLLLKPNAKVCDIGAGGRRITNNTFTIDKVDFGNTDLVCDAEQTNLPDKSFDCIFCTGLLEHVAYPNKVIREIKRLLKDGGIIHLEVPFLQGYHPDPNDYWRWTLEGLRFFCSQYGFEEMDSGVHSGPSSTLTWVINGWLLSIFGKGLIGNIVDAISRFILFPLKYLDFITLGKNDCTIANGVYFIGRKRENIYFEDKQCRII